MHPRRDQARIDATAEQRRREDAAARLRDEISTLQTLRLSFREVRESSEQTGMSYSKVVVVASAPAFFEVHCIEPRCDGRHDLTHAVLSALRQRKQLFSGESACQGVVGLASCQRVLAYECEATYAS
jgi:hypothetical protein